MSLGSQAKKPTTPQFENPTSNWERTRYAALTANEMLRKSQFETPSGVTLSPLYTPATPDPDYLENLGYPGEFPFTRGVQTSMYRGRLWTMRQYSGFGTAQATNARYKYLLSQGTTGLSVAFDLPTQMGRDSDHELAQGEVGKVGVAISSIEDMERLFDGIPLESVSTSMTINATGYVLLAMYLVVAKRRGVAWTSLRGTIQNDILKEYIARGTYIYPPEAALRVVTDIVEFCGREVPEWNTISISGYHIREAGSTAPQEVAFTFANAIAYVDSALARGLDIDDFAPRLAFFFNCHNNFLEEIAKFRAARRLWARIMRDQFGAKDPRSCMLRFHTQTAGSSLTAAQPQVNVVRTAIQALAAVLGGTQSLHTNSFDEALGLPTEKAAVLALRTQQVVACESGVADTIDPFGGSYCIEALTDTIESIARDYLEEIRKRGGMVRAIEERFPQLEIEEAAYRYQQRIECEEELIVGVNSYLDDDTSVKDMLFRVEIADEQNQIAQLTSYRAQRNQAGTQIRLDALAHSLSANENLLPAVLDAIEADATLGEISDVLRRHYGEYVP